MGSSGDGEGSDRNAIVTAVLFVGAGLLEICGGWFVWQYMREGWSYWWAALGSLSLVAYGFLVTAQVPLWHPSFYTPSAIHPFVQLTIA